MANRFSRYFLRPLAAIGSIALLGGCVAYPAYPTYPAYSSGYGYRAPYHGGWRDGERWHHRDGDWYHRDGDWRR